MYVYRLGRSNGNGYTAILRAIDEYELVVIKTCVRLR